MGTNYFAIDENYKKHHIGKLSIGWAFIFHGYDDPDFEIKSYDQWKAYLLDDKIKIIDDAHDKITTNDFLSFVDQSVPNKRHTISPDNEEWYDEKGFAFLNHYFV